MQIESNIGGWWTLCVSLFVPHSLQPFSFFSANEISEKSSEANENQIDVATKVKCDCYLVYSLSILFKSNTEWLQMFDGLTFG